MKKSILTVSVSILAGIVLVGCGGGDHEEACSPASSLLVGFNYKFAGISPPDGLVGYTPGVAFSNTPAVTGVPASCNSAKRFTIAPQIGLGTNVPLPGTVTLDPVTGTIAGTLAVPLGNCSGGPSSVYVNTTNPVCAAGGVFARAVFDVTLSLPGFSDLKKTLTFINR